MVRPANYLQRTIGKGTLWLDRPPAKLETQLSASGRYLALLFPKPGGRCVIDYRVLCYQKHLERHDWRKTADVSMVASLEDARLVAHERLRQMETNASRHRP